MRLQVTSSPPKCPYKIRKTNGWENELGSSILILNMFIYLFFAPLTNQLSSIPALGFFASDVSLIDKKVIKREKKLNCWVQCSGALWTLLKHIAKTCQDKYYSENNNGHKQKSGTCVHSFDLYPFLLIYPFSIASMSHWSHCKIPILRQKQQQPDLAAVPVD